MRVRVRWACCEACDVRERRKRRQVFFNVMKHVCQSLVNHCLRVETGMRLYTASRRLGREGRARSGSRSGNTIAIASVCHGGGRGVCRGRGLWWHFSCRIEDVIDCFNLEACQHQQKVRGRHRGR